MVHRILIFLFLYVAMCGGQSTVPDPRNPLGYPTLPNQTNAGSGELQRSPAIEQTSSVPVLNISPEGGAEFSKPAMPSTWTAGPLKAKSEFQRFAEDAAGHELPVYGRALFGRVPTTFAPADNIPVPSDYVVGPGDELIIRTWGKVILDGRFTVDRNGQVLVPKVGTLTVAGLHYSELEGRIRSAISDLYHDFEINVSLGRLRSIQIYVLGNARQPGTYTVSSLSTLINALFVCGGPSATGSMRNIELRRGNQTVSQFDVYDLLRKGDKSHDVPLLPGDVIYIAPAGPQVALIGSVQEPGIYEVKRGSTVDEVLQSAGGLTALAGTERLLIERVEDHKRRRVEEFALDAVGLHREVFDGDLLRVFPVSPQFENSVTLRGNVALPGRYAWHEGMRVSDLIPTRDSLVTRDYWNHLNHLIEPTPRGSFDVQTDGHFQEQLAYQAQMEREFRSGGPGGETAGTPANEAPDSAVVRNRGNARLDPGYSQETEEKWSAQVPAKDTTAIAAIGKNSAEINWDYAVIERLDQRDLSTRLIPFRLASAIDDHTSPDNQELRPGDVLTVFSRADLELPMEKHAVFVRVGGEVNAPGVYRMEPGNTLQDVIRRAGGLTTHSYLYASKFTRLSTRRVEEEQLKESEERMQKELMSRYAVAGVTAGQSTADQQAQLAMEQASIARLSAIKPTGRVVLQMKPAASTIEDLPAFPLEDGDALYIPPRLSTVQVTGSVYNPNAFRYQPGKDLRAYLDDAGGPTRESDKRRIFVIRADGTVISKQSKGSHSNGKFDHLRLLPGDAIVVPERVRMGGMRGLQDLTQIISQSSLTAAALSTVVR